MPVCETLTAISPSRGAIDGTSTIMVASAKSRLPYRSGATTIFLNAMSLISDLIARPNEGAHAAPQLLLLTSSKLLSPPHAARAAARRSQLHTGIF